MSGWVGGFSVAGLLLNVTVRLMFRKLSLVCLGGRWGRGVGRVSVVVGRLGLPVTSLYDGWFTPSDSVAVRSGVISVLIGSGGLENSMSPCVRSVMSVCIDCSIRSVRPICQGSHHVRSIARARCGFSVCVWGH